MAKQKTSELLLYGDIGESWFEAEPITSKSVAARLKEIGSVDVLNVRINSAGGSAQEGFGIYNQLARSSARVVVDIDGYALSIASIIAMAGKEIRMAENAAMMIHEPWTIAAGAADDFRKMADVLDLMKDNLVTTYNTRTGIDRAELADMMAEETWFTAAQAKERGFVDTIVQGNKAEAQNRGPVLLSRAQAARFRNTPKNFVERADNVRSIAAVAAADHIAAQSARDKVASIAERARRFQQGQAR